MERYGKEYHARYAFETDILPHLFYDLKDRFVAPVLKDKNVLYATMNEVYKSHGIENPYTEDQITIDLGRITDEVLMLKLVFPEPEMEPFCYWSYLLFDRNFEKCSYFCVEKGRFDDKPFICEWDMEGNHQNYGKAPFENDEDFLRCVDVHMKKHYNMERRK